MHLFVVVSQGYSALTISALCKCLRILLLCHTFVGLEGQLGLQSDVFSVCSSDSRDSAWRMVGEQSCEVFELWGRELEVTMNV